MSFCYVTALVVTRPSFHPSIPNRSYPFALLYLLVIFALKHLVAKPNHCILIARYFVSRCPLFYVLYYLPRLDSGCVKWQSVYIRYTTPESSSIPEYREHDYLPALGKSIVSGSPARVIIYKYDDECGAEETNKGFKG